MVCGVVIVILWCGVLCSFCGVIVLGMMLIVDCMVYDVWSGNWFFVLCCVV